MGSRFKQADRMINSYIAKKDLDSEMTVVRNEFESGENNPSRILNQRIVSTAYLWHNYGKSTIGARSDIENVPILINSKHFIENIISQTMPYYWLEVK